MVCRVIYCVTFICSYFYRDVCCVICCVICCVNSDVIPRASGIPCIDASIPRGVPGAGRLFTCKVLLLYWCGDFPAICKVSGTHEKVCHWCEHKPSHQADVNRLVWGGFRSYLPEGHPWRRASGIYGPACTDDAPPPRTHENFVAQGVANEEYMERVRVKSHPRVYKSNAPWKETGAVPMFLPDWLLSTHGPRDIT